MTESVEIQCITKRDRQSPYERISNVGGIHNGEPWNLTLDDAIQGVLDGRWRFWTQANGKSVWVEVDTHNGHRYLKTGPDGTKLDNLLSLAACPI